MSSLTQQGWTWFSQALTQHDSFSGYFQPLIQLLAPKWTTDAYRAHVVEIRDEMTDMYTLVLKPATGVIDQRWPAFQAGQFVELMIEKDGARTTRCFSISSSPAYYQKTGLIELSIRIQKKGRITPWIRQQLQKNDLVNLSVAQGDFVLPSKTKFTYNESGNKPEKLLFIAGGSGVTPFRSMLQQLKNSSTALDIHLLYYSRDKQQILFHQEFQQLEKELANLSITFVDSELDGFINTRHLQEYCADYAQRSAYICGPSPMIQQTRKVLAELDVAKEKIHFEFFGAAPIEMDKNTQGAVHFQTSDKVWISEEGQQNSLLEQAEELGLKPVSGCRIGVCHQCICKKKSGVVFNTRTREYSDTGTEEIQLCISVAQGDVVLDL